MSKIFNLDLGQTLAKKDEPLAELSTLEVAAWLLCTYSIVENVSVFELQSIWIIDCNLAIWLIHSI